MQIDTETEEGKAELQKIIDKETEGLKAKNAELLGNQKKLRDEMKAIQDQLDEIADAKKKAEEEAALKSGDVDKIRKQLEEKNSKAVAELEAKLKEKDSTLHALLVDQGLTEALTKQGVAPQYLDAAKALIKTTNKAEITDSEKGPVAMFDGKPLTDFVSEWSQGDQGKHFKAAPDNGGGGANGANGGGKASGGRQISRSEWDAMGHAQRMAASKEGAKVIDD